MYIFGAHHKCGSLFKDKNKEVNNEKVGGTKKWSN